MPKPPNNPSKPPQSNSKRTRATSPSGWTHITKGPTPHLHHPQTTALQQQHHHQQQPTSPTPTLQPYITRFKTYYLPQWQSSTCWTNLSLLFKNEIIPSFPRKHRITNCVCLGLGSLTNGGSASWWQLAALVSILELLLDTSSPHDSQIPFSLIFQDPIFTPADEIFLTDHLPSFLYTSSDNPVNVTVKVVKDPDALGMMGEETFLFAPHLEVGVFARALERGGEGGPVCCIGSDVGEYVDGLVILSSSLPFLAC